jgi:arabinan endo-1,5-alpha-L-arabinosidase
LNSLLKYNIYNCSAFLAFVLVIETFVHSYSDPGLCTGACWAHDPTAIQRASDGKYFKLNSGTGIDFATSNSLAGTWTLQGFVLPNGSSIDNAGSQNPWAPDALLVGDEHFLYYAVSTFGSRVSAIGLATSLTMEPGTWIDKGGVGIASKKGQAYNASRQIKIPTFKDYWS